MKRILFLFFGLMAVTVLAGDEVKEQQEANRKTVAGLNASRKKLFEGREDMLVLPGLTADKKEKKVTILAESTSLNKGDAVEFFLIAEGSGHDYEATAISFATAGDIIKAMEFIGMTPGACVNYRENRFWSRGERVKVLLGPRNDPKKLVPIERYVVDDRTGKSLPEEGFAFTGSILVDDGDRKGVLAADAREPKSIISNYNEPETVFDIPYQGSQDVIYDHLHAGGEAMLPPAELLEVVIEPEYKDGSKRVCEFSLSVVPAAAVGSITNHAFAVTDASGKLLNADKGLKSALELFIEKNKAGKDVYVHIALSDELQAGDAWQICQLLQSLESAGSIRIEPPAAGRLFYKAFVPNPAYLDRAARSGHPWELRIKKGKKGLTGKLTQCEFVWNDASSGSPEVKAADFEIASPEVLRKTIAENTKQRLAAGKDPNIAVILAIVAPEITIGEVMGFIKPSMDIVPMVHVYVRD